MVNDDGWVQDFECIPLQTLHSETCPELPDEEIFFGKGAITGRPI